MGLNEWPAIQPPNQHSVSLRKHRRATEGDADRDSAQNNYSRVA